MKTPKNDRSTVRSESITLLISPKDKNTVEELSSELGISMSALCRLALMQHLKEHGKEI